MKTIKFIQRLNFLQKKDKTWYPLNRLIKSPFKTWKSALKFLYSETNKKTCLSNFEPTDIDWALLTLFKSKAFMKKVKHGKIQ